VNILDKISFSRKLAMLVFNMIFRFLPEYYQPYGKPVHWIKRGLLRIALKKCGNGLNVGFACAVSPHVEIGDYSSFGNRCVIQGGVKIGSYVLMGPDVKIYTRNHNMQDISIPMRSQGDSLLPVTIGDDVWMACNVVILPGVKIGSHAVIGAGAIVVKDVPEYAVVVGNPARIVKFRNQVVE
jgi:maltose O-acetyltransferase